MPRRLEPLVNGEYYHVINRGNYGNDIFRNAEDYSRAIITLKFYRYQEVPCKLSYYLDQTLDKRQIIMGQLAGSKKRVEIIAHTLMPNHYHLLLRQITDNGISKFMADFQNSYTKAYNARHHVNGILLGKQFKAIHIESEEQLLHTSRYMHINPNTAGLITKDQIFSYPWSSANEYATGIPSLTNLELLDYLNVKEYQEFVLEYADTFKLLKQEQRNLQDF